jgi:hypothetical protein
MATLKDQHKRFILERLACYDSPSEVRDALEEALGVRAELDQIVYYDATTGTGRQKLGRKWKEYFEAVRKRFVEDSSQIPIAHKNFRLRQLEKMARKAHELKNYVLVKDLLEQAAKEMGEAYTNRRIVDGRLRLSNLQLSPEDVETAGIDELVDSYFGLGAE